MSKLIWAHDLENGKTKLDWNREYKIGKTNYWNNNFGTKIGYNYKILSASRSAFGFEIVKIKTIKNLHKETLDECKTLDEFYSWILSKGWVFMNRNNFPISEIIYKPDLDRMMSDQINFVLMCGGNRNIAEYRKPILDWMNSHFSKWQIISKDRRSIEIELSFTHCPSLQLLRGL